MKAPHEIRWSNLVLEVDQAQPQPGVLYVIELDSGWIKVGRTTNWRRRRSDHARTYRAYGWTIIREWQSVPVSNRSADPKRTPDLEAIERQLIKEAHRTSDGSKLNPWLDGVGRDKSKRAETETFCGCDFGYLTAYADVLARCVAL